MDDLGTGGAAAEMVETRPVVQAVHRLEPSILSVWLVDSLAARLDRGHSSRTGERPARGTRLVALLSIAILPLAVELLLRLLDRGSTYPVIAWLGVYAAFAVYLMVASSFIWTRLCLVAHSIEALLDGPIPRANVATWIAKRSKRIHQLPGLLAAATLSAAAMGITDEAYPSLHISWAWYFSTWLTVFLAADAVSWVLRFIWLTSRIGRERNLVVSTFAPVQTPAVRELRDFAATVAAVTGVGLFFFATPLVWAVAFVLAQHQSASQLRTLSIAPFAGTALIAVAAAFAPQYFIASFVGRERDAILDDIDQTIPKGDPLALLDKDVERRSALFNAIASTGSTSGGMSTLTRRAAGLLVPLVPLLFTFLATALGFATSPSTASKKKASAAAACVICGAPRPVATLLPAEINPTPAIPNLPGSAEPVIGETTSRKMARLALEYQPTVKMSIFDRFWPVSVQVALNEHDNGRYTCLVDPGGVCGKPDAPVRLSQLRGNASPKAYLDYPEPLVRVRAQFNGFMSALGFGGTAIEDLWNRPATLDPYPWAQVYFYYAGRAPYSYKPAPAGLISLQYWFFYTFNYYPTLVSDRHLMVRDPIAADLANSDYHEGDWEHVTVLLDSKTKEPRWLWMARHKDEGTSIPWSQVTLDGSHPVVYPALGGHPSYQTGCRAWRRGGNPLFKIIHFADYVGCVPGFFVFSGASTPLVDLRHVAWSCWPGHFGKAGAALRIAGQFNDPTGLYRVAGPRSPLRQAENGNSHSCGARRGVDTKA